MRDNVLFVLYGTAFGFVLSRSGAADYDFIQGMFLFTELQLYGIIGSAVVVTAVGLKLLRRYGRTVTGEPIAIRAKTFNRGTVVGGVLFGVGWAIAGVCPGPIVVNIGEGKIYGLATFAGMLTGTYMVGLFYDRLRGPLGMPGLHAAEPDAQALS